MGEELKPQEAATPDVSAAPAAGEPGEAPDAGAVSEQATLESLAPEVRTAIQAEVKTAQEAVRAEYEGDDGHISKLKSQRDKLKNRLADAERVERQQALARHEQARSLVESEPGRAATLALEQNAALLAQQQQVGQREEVSTWVTGVMRDMGYDLDDDENLELAAAKTQRIMDGAPSAVNPDGADYAYEVQQDLARGIAKQKDEQIAARDKKIKAMEDGLQAMVRDEVTRAIAGTNSPDGGAPGAGVSNEAWREKPAGQKRKDGLAARRAAPVRKVVKDK